MKGLKRPLSKWRREIITILVVVVTKEEDSKVVGVGAKWD
jgi:hypothetical protein